MKRFFIGRSPLTSISGYILAILTGIHEMGIPSSHHWQDYLLPAALALFGRLAGDDQGTPPRPCPQLSPVEASDEQQVDAPSSFLRRGRKHNQQRKSNGQFGASLA